MGKQRGLVTAQVTSRQGQSSLDPGLQPLTANLRAGGGGAMNEQEGPMVALTGKARGVLVGPGVGVPHHPSEASFLYLAWEGVSVPQRCFEALTRKWDIGPSPVCAWPLRSPRLCKRHLLLLGTAVLGVCRHWPCLVSGVGRGAVAAGPLCSFGSLGTLLSLSQPPFPHLPSGHDDVAVGY